MKKSLFATIVLLAMMALACQHTVKDNAPKLNEEEIRQRIEQMMLLDNEQILTAEMLAIQQHAMSVHYEGAYCFGFEWNTGVFDACSEPTLSITEVKPIDSLHCDVGIHYLDEGCYDFHYTLNLLKEKGQWLIDNVTYDEGIYATLRVECDAFYEDVAEFYRTADAEEILENLLSEEPDSWCYITPSCLYFDNPEALQGLIDNLRNCHELFKQNPGYTEEYGIQIDEMIERIAEHI